jgi:hypothetical protein
VSIVALYRIFRFDRDNRFAGVELATFPTDDCALVRAAKLVTEQHGAEVWDRDRIVATLAPREPRSEWRQSG